MQRGGDDQVSEAMEVGAKGGNDTNVNRNDSMGVTEGPLHLLLEACASITATALSCKTLGHGHHHVIVLKGGVSATCCDTTNNDSEIEAAYEDEMKMSTWLEAQIADYEAALERRKLKLQRHKKRPREDNGATATATATTRSGTHESSTTKQDIKRLKEDLFDGTVRVQQERLLISRIRMASAASGTVFSNDASNSSVEPSIMDEERFLRRQALESRDELVESAVGKLCSIDESRKKLTEASKEFRSLQDQNRKLWGQLSSSTSNRVVAAENSSKKTDEPESSTTEELQKENVILKRALMDSIIGSGLDWYSDDRLRNTILKLED
eukprot:scaffold2113_cov63-Attheya_sp.AAC.13